MRHRSLREEACEANRLLPQHQLVDITFGNVSVLDRDAGIFAIKPSGVDYKTLTPELMVLVDLEGNTVDSALKPSSDAPTHRRLFQAFSHMRAVVHTHSRHATAFAQMGRAIPCLGTTHADYFYGDVPVTRTMTEAEVAGAYEWETGNVIVERFASLDAETMRAVLVHGHGTFVWGASGMQAVESALALEIVADMALKVLNVNPEARRLPQHLIDRHYRRKHGSASYYGQARILQLN